MDVRQPTQKLLSVTHRIYILLDLSKVNLSFHRDPCARRPGQGVYTGVDAGQQSVRLLAVYSTSEELICSY